MLLAIVVLGTRVLLMAAQSSGAQGVQAPAGANASLAPTLLAVKRVYVAPFSGGAGAAPLRALIMDRLSATNLFVITENPERADATLKGAADDHTFEDTLDKSEGSSVHENTGKGSSSASSRAAGAFVYGVGSSENESYHIKERKHEAYAAVRLCNKDGDVLWSTTQESLGAKFRGASADVATKVAHQLTLDVDRMRRGGGPETPRP